MKVSSRQVDVYERLTDLCLKVFLFVFVLLGVAVLTGFFIFCVMTNKSAEAQAISGFGDLVFFGAFGTLVWYFFSKKGDKPAENSVLSTPLEPKN